MGKVWTIISGKGGVGKSTIAVMLGLVAAENSGSVLLIDGDIGSRSLDILLNMEDKIVYDMGDFFAGRCDLGQAIYSCDCTSGLYLMAAGQNAKISNFEITHAQKLIKSLKERYDMVIIDCPPGLGKAVEVFATCGDEIIIVASPDPVSIRCAEKSASFLWNQYQLSANLLFNKVINSKKAKDKFPAIARFMDLKYLGMIPNLQRLYEQAVETGHIVACVQEEPLHTTVQRILASLQGSKTVQTGGRFFQSFLNRLRREKHYG